jgi:mono/diheme cytochrome c family protein
MSKLGLPILAVLVMLSLIPFAFVARSRASKSSAAPIHLVMDMDLQPRKNTQTGSVLFRDGRAMRPQIEGTVAREDMSLEPEILNDATNPRLLDSNNTLISIGDAAGHAAITLGRTRGANQTDEQFNAAKPVNLVNPNANDDDIAKDTFYVRTIPSQIKVTADFLRRGQERFMINCGPCHGNSGYGDGAVHKRVELIQEAGVAGREVSWTAPQNLHEAKIRSRPDGHIFNTITHGIRTMPAYDKQVSVLDRWAIVAYVRALQNSQNAPPELAGNR